MKRFLHRGMCLVVGFLMLLMADGALAEAPTEAVESGEPAKLAGTLFVYCAAGVKDPVLEIAKAFEKEAGVKVEFTFANSGQLLGQIETTRSGDVYIPGDVGFAAKAKEKNLLAGNPVEFCHFVPAIYVRKGNPKNIKGVSDLERPGLKLALADVSSAVGRIQADLFKKNGSNLEALKKNTVFSPALVTDVALAVKMGSVDAGIIWDALGTFAPDQAEIVRIPAEKNVTSTVGACALTVAKNPKAAVAFLRLLSSEKGRDILKGMGFTVVKP